MKSKLYGTVKQWRDACRELLDWYTGRQGMLHKCPFCKVVDCRVCIWVLIENISCSQYVSYNRLKWLNYTITDLRTERPAIWTDLRIPMLKKWINILNCYPDNAVFEEVYDPKNHDKLGNAIVVKKRRTKGRCSNIGKESN